MFQHPRRNLLALAVTAAVAVPVGAVAAPPGGGSGTPSPVIVTNDGTKPVPVTAASPLPVSLGEQPLPVSLGDQPLPVSLGDQPVPVSPAGEPVDAFDPMTLAPGENQLVRDLITVPAGQRLVVEYVSGQTIRTATGRMRMLLGRPGRTLATLPMQPGFGDEPNGIVRGIISEETHLVVNGPSTLHATILRNDPDVATPISNGITVHGTLYPCPSCQ